MSVSLNRWSPVSGLTPQHSSLSLLQALINICLGLDASSQVSLEPEAWLAHQQVSDRLEYIHPYVSLLPLISNVVVGDGYMFCFWVVPRVAYKADSCLIVI